MIFNKKNLEIVNLIDKVENSLSRIFIDRLGNTFAINKDAIIVVSSVNKAIRADLKPIFGDVSNRFVDCDISVDSIKDILKATKRDTTFNGMLENFSISKKGEVIINNGKTKTKLRITLQKIKIAYKDILERVLGGEDEYSITINAGNLKKLVDTAIKVSSTENELKLILKKNNVLVLKTKNYNTKQKILGIIQGFNNIKLKFGNKWERNLYKNSEE